MKRSCVIASGAEEKRLRPIVSNENYVLVIFIGNENFQAKQEAK